MRAVSATMFESTNGMRYEGARDALADDLSHAGTLDGLYSELRSAIYSSPALRSAACDQVDAGIDVAFATLRRYRAIVAQIRGLES